MIPVFIPVCIDCKHLRREDLTLYCPAFPEGIPRAIWEERIAVKSLPECGNGCKFEDKKSKFEA